MVRSSGEYKGGGDSQGFGPNDQKFLERLALNLHRMLTVYGYFQPRTCFVAMPFKEPFDSLYRLILKPTIERYRFECKREDEYGPIGVLPENIVSHIASSTFVVADISCHNPNVHYELGIAHTGSSRGKTGKLLI